MARMNTINDLYLSGFLVANGIPVKSHSKEGNTTIFCFEQTEKLDELVQQYYSLNASVNPQRYGSALKILKNLIYQANDNHNNYGNYHSQSRRIS
jgi:hypothetical protein